MQFRNQSNNLIWEELVSRNGFSGIYSNLYHRNPPTAIREIGKLKQINLNSNIEVHRHHHFKTRKIKLGGDLISSRIPLLFNDDLVIYKAHIDRSMKNLYKNGHGDEIIYIQNGHGLIMSNFGCLNFSEGDYIIIPKGVIWKAEIIEETRALIIESKYPLETPNRYRNTFGQLLEHSPFAKGISEHLILKNNQLKILALLI